MYIPLYSTSYNKYILLHDWEGNTGEYSVRGWQYWPDHREGQYITRELNIVRPKRNAIIDMTQIWWEKWKGRRKGKRKREGKKARAAAAGEDRTRAPSLVKTALSPIGLPRLEPKASSKRAYNCHGNQENAVLKDNTASYCPPIDQSELQYDL